MRYTFFALLLFGTALNPARAQLASLKGNLKDTINQSIPSHTVVLLLKPKDSVMVGFTRSDAQGRFSMEGLAPGGYLIWISHPAFAEYRDSIHLDPGPNDMGNIFLTLRSKILQEVIIKGIPPMHMKGDTLEYAADSFAVRPNATVEDLLKVMPGIQVDKNGKITAQGQTVTTVLVDGEEFFGDDPTVATRGLPASSVEKVQVFDKKSDQATFTGIDDGQRTRTINLELKKDKKKGYFGKVDAGAGSDGYYQNDAALNLFEKKRKISVYGIDANTGTAGLGYQDQENYTSQTWIPRIGSADLVSIFPSGNQDFTNWSGSYNGQGVPAALNFGGHYGNKWDDDKIDLNGDYNFNQVKVGVDDNTTSQLILPDSVVNNTKDKSNSYVTDVQHLVNGKYFVTLDTTSQLKLYVQARMRHKDALTNDTSYTTNGEGNPLNQSFNNTFTSGQNNTFNSTLIWQKKFHKTGRSLYALFQENWNEINSTGYQNGLLSTYAADSLQSIDTTNQYKTSYSRSFALQSQVMYTEPLGHDMFLTADYVLGLLNGASIKNTYNQSPGTAKYTALDTIYSNSYTLDVLANTGGLNLRKVGKSYNLSLGSDVGYTHYNENNLYADSLQHRGQINFYPHAGLMYKFSGTGNIWFNYNGNTTQPTLDQLQPFANNNNPLNIQVGNPNLKPSFTNNLRANMSSFNVLKNRGFYSYISFDFVENAFSNRDSVSPVGQQFNQTVNVQGNESGNFFLVYQMKIKKGDFNLDVETNDTYAKNIGFVNSLQNDTKSAGWNLEADVNKQVAKSYAFRFGAGATYNTSVSSIQSSNNTQYWTSDINGDVSKDLPWKFTIDVNGDASLRQKTPLFTTNTSTFICNAYLEKRFLKGENLVFRLAANDIFNQNTGFSRDISTNYISQSLYTAIHRFYMISINWNFSKNGKPQNGPMMIMR